MRYVIKIGSSSLTLPDGDLNKFAMSRYVSGLAQLVLDGHEVVLVTSGAVAAGYGRAGFQKRPSRLVEKQAAAAIGQCLLVHEYHQLFAPYGIATAQILLTAEDLHSETRCRNAVTTLEYLLSLGVVPIINENDTVAVEELTFGDNDQLSAMVATSISANGLVLITDTDGLYNMNPHQHSSATRLQQVAVWDDGLLDLAEGSSEVGSGGMRSKLLATARVLQAGIPCFIGKAHSPGELLSIFSGGGCGTYFGGHLTERAFTECSRA